jgi:hypothetical protein
MKSDSVDKLLHDVVTVARYIRVPFRDFLDDDQLYALVGTGERASVPRVLKAHWEDIDKRIRFVGAHSSGLPAGTIKLFDVEKVPFHLIHELRASIPYREHIQSGSYFNLRLTFEDLKLLLKITAKHIPISSLYKKMPLTLNDLILKRSPQPSSEIGALALVPVFQMSEIDSDFSGDLKGAAATLRATA